MLFPFQSSFPESTKGLAAQCLPRSFMVRVSILSVVQLACLKYNTNQTAIFGTAFGSIITGSTTAFSDLVGAFAIFTTMSYFFAVFPHILSGRKYAPKGPFWLGKWGMPINIATVLVIIFFNVIYCLRKFGRWYMSQELMTSICISYDGIGHEL